jgi:pantetheine-phosphate adenylyltransferase
MLAKKKNVQLIESLETREQHVRDYVAFLKPSLQVDFVVLADAFGPSIVVDDSDAVLVVSTETVAAVPKIQEMRASRQLAPLKIFICRRTDASTLSSSFLRDQLAVQSGKTQRS